MRLPSTTCAQLRFRACALSNKLQGHTPTSITVCSVTKFSLSQPSRRKNQILRLQSKWSVTGTVRKSMQSSCNARNTIASRCWRICCYLHNILQKRLYPPKVNWDYCPRRICLSFLFYHVYIPADYPELSEKLMNLDSFYNFTMFHHIS